MEGNTYTRKAYKEIYFSNSDVSFEFFYKNMGRILSELITEQNLYKINKKIFSFMGNFLHAVDTDDKKNDIQLKWLEICKEIESDEELKKLIRYDQQNIDVTVPYLKKFYYYYFQQIKLLSYFLSSLDRTYMPTTDLNKSLFKWKNYIQFFNSYIDLKQTVTNNLGSFSILNFQQHLNGILVFYYAYNQYVTEISREVIESIFNKLIEYVSNEEFLKLVTRDYKSSKDYEVIENIKWRINHILLEIYNRINVEHSIYNIIPKVQKKIYIDSTNI